MSSPYSSTSFVEICDLIFVGTLAVADEEDEGVIAVVSDDMADKTLLTDGSAIPGTESSIQVCFGD
jgi:hypothetical protein